MANKKYQSNSQLTQMLLNFISVCVGGGGEGVGGVYNPDKTQQDRF